MTVLLIRNEPGARGVARWHTKKSGFCKNIKKSGSLIMGDKELV